MLTSRGSAFASCLLAGLVLGACAKDALNTNYPILNVSIVPQPYYVSSSDTPVPTIDLGAVPLLVTRVATFKLDNPSPISLVIQGISITTKAGERWSLPSVLPTEIRPWAAIELNVQYTPQAPDNADSAEVTLATNAAQNPTQVVRVTGTGLFLGTPDLEISFPGYTGPLATECTAGSCVAAHALDFGNIPLGEEGTVEVTLRNRATCEPIPGGPCSTCTLFLSPDPARKNVGFGFLADENPEGRFGIASVALPLEIRQRNIDCQELGETRALVTFAAGDTDGEFSSTLYVESNDPEAALVAIPVKAFARNAPVAIAKLKEFDAGNPSADWTDPNDIRPLDRVYLDGRDSYDPIDPADPTLLVNYTWEVLSYPDGSNPNDFAFQGQGTALFSFWLPLAGDYTVRLTVRNDAGITSGDTAQARVTFTAIPGSRVHVQLVWDDPTNDMDLHLANVQATSTKVCETPWDCYFKNPYPVWFSEALAGDGPNPRLDIDDTDGLGPENINIDTPKPGTYRIFAMFYVDSYSTGHATPTGLTVRIYLNGLEAAEYKRTLNPKDVWAVADIVWTAGNTGTLNPYPSDAPPAIGKIVNMPVDPATTCDVAGSAGWVFP